jgi:MoxR-like ATPase
MIRNRIAIGDGKKQVWASNPYISRLNTNETFVGREEEMKMITAAWIAGESAIPLSPLLVGEPGVGKNRLIYELAHRTGRKLYIFQGHQDVTAEDLACAVRFSDDNAKIMDYVASPLVTAMHEGGICFIDEIGKVRPRALALLVSVLDERRYIDSTLLSERVMAHPGFRFVAATNTGEINSLPEFIRSRMRPVIKIGYPKKEEINSIVERQFSAQKDSIKKLLEIFWKRWSDKYGETGRSPSPRDAIHLFALATSLSDFDRMNTESPLIDAKKDKPFPLETGTTTCAITPKHIELAFDELFVQQIN